MPPHDFALSSEVAFLKAVFTLTYGSPQLQAFSFPPYNRTMSHALVLNASFEPLHVVSWQRALQLLFQGKVEVVEESEHEVRTVRFTIKVPAVLRLLNYVPLKTKKQIVRFSRSNIFIRDQNVCQYCGNKFGKAQLTLDHVIPIVQGGKKSWENIVTACKPCNQRKGGRTPNQASMQLIGRPKRPSWLPTASFQMGVAITPERWKIYLRLEQGDPDDHTDFS
jgi:5-methylcytosine-specific restriction endonuclease McrA